MTETPGRTVRLLVLDGTGALLGALPEFDVDVPWWSETESVQVGARRRYGAQVTVVRILRTDRPGMGGGVVTYLAQVDGDPPRGLVAADGAGDRVTDRAADRTADVTADVTGDVTADLDSDEPHRMWWARPGGVAEAVAWATGIMAEGGRALTGPVAQVKSWNLSLVLRLPTKGGDVWLKATPPFMRHEGAAVDLAAAAGARFVPHLLGRDPARGVMLMDDVSGEDRWQAGPVERARMMVDLVGIQAALATGADRLAVAGVPAAPLAGLAADLSDLLSRIEVRNALSRAELRNLGRTVDLLPARVAAVAECGVPETLVHGDFHPGNWRGGESAAVLLDWGDSHLGNPLLDVDRMADWPDPPEGPASHGPVRTAAVRAWRDAVPGCDPDRALDLVAPLGALRGAVVYQRFLDLIEPDERRYHADDPADCLRLAAADERLSAP